jgi:hypothetical protein
MKARPDDSLPVGLADHAHDAVGLLTVDDGAGCAAGVQGITRHPGARLGNQALNEFVMNGALHVKASVGRTHLALVEKIPKAALSTAGSRH